MYITINFSTGGRRFSEGTSADREIQRTLMELLNQMDGFDSLGQVNCLDHGSSSALFS
jgi:ATP-dependent 26S proteasome regulatory subunit